MDINNDRDFINTIGTKQERTFANVHIQHILDRVKDMFFGYAITEETRINMAEYIHIELEYLAAKNIIPAFLWITDNEVTIKDNPNGPYSLDVILPESLEMWLDG